MPSIDNIYRNPGRWRAVIHTQDVRHGTAGCLLSVILFAPLFVRQMGMTTVVLFVLVYGLIIVPAITKFFSPIKVLLKLGRTISRIFLYLRQLVRKISLILVLNRISSSTSALLEGIAAHLLSFLRFLAMPFFRFIYCFFPCIHEFYVTLDGFRITSNQIVFFLLCEKLFSPDDRLISLSYLLFYTILAYLHRSLIKRQWATSLYESNMRDFIQLTTWFIAVRLAKGVAMTFVLIIFTMQVKNVDANLNFVLVTFSYFVLTQKKWTGNEEIVFWFRCLEIDALEEEEDFWVPVFIKAVTVMMSLVAIATASSKYQYLCLISLYTNVVVPYLQLRNEYEERYSSQNLYLTNFKKSSAKDLKDDPICPVCLENIRVARVTPCNHLFHAICLRKCIAITTLCPLCKQDLYPA